MSTAGKADDSGKSSEVPLCFLRVINISPLPSTSTFYSFFLDLVLRYPVLVWKMDEALKNSEQKWSSRGCHWTESRLLLPSSPPPIPEPP